MQLGCWISEARSVHALSPSAQIIDNIAMSSMRSIAVITLAAFDLKGFLALCSELE